MQNSIKDIIKFLDPEPNREGLNKTPKRAAEALYSLTSGYQLKLKDVVNNAVYPAKSSGTIHIKDLNFYSLCEHHLLPFYGTCNISYIPNNLILGISKFGRILDMYSKRLQLQENLNKQVFDAIMYTLNPKCLVVSMEGMHSCMISRGVQKINSKTITVESTPNAHNMLTYN